MTPKTKRRILIAWSSCFCIFSAYWAVKLATRPDLDLRLIAVHAAAIALHLFLLAQIARDLSRNRRALARADASLFAWAAVFFDRSEHDHPRRHLRAHALAGAQIASAHVLCCERLS